MARVLIVEDSLVFSRTLTKRIGAANPSYETAVAETMADAKRLVAEQSFDIAVLDLTLPDAPGGEIVDFITERQIPSIVFTGTFDPALRERLLAKDVFDYLLKDNPDAVVSVVRSIDRFFLNQRSAILVVDDSSTMRKQIAKMLKALCIPLLEAGNGAEALTVLAAHPEVRLVITDCYMPGMDGFELVSTIRKKHPREEMAIIGISSEGATNNMMSAKFLKVGANDFLTKPFFAEELHNKIALNLELIERFGVVKEQAVHLTALNQTKNRFLGMAAHDLRNPLASVRGFSEILLGEATGPDNATSREFLGLIHNLSDEMLGMVNELLDVATIESGKGTLAIKPACLSDLVKTRLRLSRVTADKKGIVVQEMVEALPEFPFDQSKVAQVIDNLVSNAVKFSPANSTVSVTLSTSQEKSRTYALFAVADQGPGLTAEDQSKLFGEFAKLSAKPTAGEKSTGLGLSIVKKIVTDHGGRIWATSTPGAGAVFQFMLPTEGAPQ